MPRPRIGFILLLGACAGPDGPGVEESPPLPVEVMQVQVGPLAPEVRASAVAQARLQVTVVSEATGRVVELSAEVGQAVAAGDALARLESGRQRNAVAAAQATRDKAQAVLDDARAKRARAARLGDAVSPANLESIELSEKVAAADLAAAEAQLAAQQRALADMTVRAPFDGVVSRRLLDLGQVITAGTPVAGVVDASALRARLGIPPEAAAGLRPGDPATLEAMGVTLEGDISEISLELDRATGSVPVEVRAPNPGLALRPNTPVTVTLRPAEGREALLIPQDAVLERFGEPVAFVVEAQTARLRRLELGERAAGQVEVRAGLEAGQALVVLGADALSDGAAVTVAR